MSESACDKSSSVILPEDLEREIFEWTAALFPGNAFKLVTISRQVQTWCVLPLCKRIMRLMNFDCRIENFMYRTVVLDSERTKIKTFMQAIDRKQEMFMTRHVKHLYLTCFVLEDDARKAIEACQGVQSLVYWSRYPTTWLHLEKYSSTLTRLSIEGWDLPSASAVAEFPNLTHLGVVNPLRSTDWSIVYVLPRLTHISIGEVMQDRHLFLLPILDGILRRCLLLEHMVIISGDLEIKDFMTDSGHGRLLDDSRLSVKEFYHHPKNYDTFWDDVQHEREDVWPI